MVKMATKIFILSVILLLVNVNALPRVDPIVDTSLGLIRGLSSPDGDYSMFLGIPYATVNASNPFGPSTPHPGFTRTFDAYDGSAICPQNDEYTSTPTGSLDCLHLSVFVPSRASSRNRLPVMVWIHGGAFNIGSYSSDYGPDFFLRHDVVVVTINYRLGIYGFMCLHTPEVPGNQGLKDQLTALRWVKNNIEAFGGDSNQITLFGESAGSVSVDYHNLYTTENLFNRIIMQSGAVLSTFALSDPDLDVPTKLAVRLGFATENTNEALNFLTTVDVNLLLAATQELPYFGPCVEQTFDGVESFVTDYPVNINYTRNIPILLGFNEQESIYLFTREISGVASIESQNLVFYEGLRDLFDFPDDLLDEMENNVRQFYMGDKGFDEDVLMDVITFSSDVTFNYPVYRTIQKYLSLGIESIFFYKFSYVGDRNSMLIAYNLTSYGLDAGHADELGYLFDRNFLTESPTPEDQLVIDRMTSLWTTFAKQGNPTPAATELVPLEWPTVTADSLNYLSIDQELSIRRRPFNDRMAYWDLFFRANERYQKGYRID